MIYSTLINLYCNLQEGLKPKSDLGDVDTVDLVNKCFYLVSTFDLSYEILDADTCYKIKFKSSDSKYTFTILAIPTSLHTSDGYSIYSYSCIDGVYIDESISSKLYVGTIYFNFDKEFLHNLLENKSKHLFMPDDIFRIATQMSFILDLTLNKHTLDMTKGGLRISLDNPSDDLIISVWYYDIFICKYNLHHNDFESVNKVLKKIKPISDTLIDDYTIFTKVFNQIRSEHSISINFVHFDTDNEHFLIESTVFNSPSKDFKVGKLSYTFESSKNCLNTSLELIGAEPIKNKIFVN